MKQKVLELLAGDDLQQIRAKLELLSAVEVINPLFSALCSADERVKWHAVSAFGWTVSAIAGQDMESARVIMRRFLWSLNDESGGIGWGAAEAMAEIMAVDQRLAEEYLHMLVSYTREDGPELFQDGNYIELPMLQRGLLWGLGRLCAVRPALLQEKNIGPDLASYLDSADGVVRGMALWALTNLGDDLAVGRSETLCHDQTELAIYWQGRQTTHTVAELARDYRQLVRGR
ncbi:MAG: DVU0298 family protein [Desulfopila sp.]